MNVFKMKINDDSDLFELYTSDKVKKAIEKGSMIELVVNREVVDDEQNEDILNEILEYMNIRVGQHTEYESYIDCYVYRFNNV